MFPVSALLGIALLTACGDKDDQDTGGDGATAAVDSGSVLDDGSGDASGDDGAGDGDPVDTGDDGGGEGSGDDGTTDDGGGDDGGMDEGGGDDGGMDDSGGDDGGADDGGEDDGGEDDSGGSSGSGSSGSGSSGSGSSGSGSSGGGSGSSTTDTDGDGQTDADEIAAGTDPSDYYDRSYTGGYNVATCGSSLPTASTPSGSWNGSATTYAVGDTVANFILTDHHGESVDLYSFCDNHVMIVFSAVWCGSCASVAGQAQSKQNTYASQGFQYLEVLVEDRTGSAVDATELNQWASSYSLSSVPVLDDSSRTEQVYYERNWSYPTIVHLEAGTMQVLDIDTGTTSLSSWL